MYIHLYLVSDNTFNANKSCVYFMHYQYFKNWYKIIVKPPKYNSIYS